MINIKRTKITTLRKFANSWYEVLKKPQAEILFLICIFGLSFIIRYIGLKFSYPLITYGDESAILEPVFNMAKNLES
jgi:hypothetical protein